MNASLLLFTQAVLWLGREHVEEVWTSEGLPLCFLDPFLADEAR